MLWAQDFCWSSSDLPYLSDMQNQFRLSNQLMQNFLLLYNDSSPTSPLNVQGDILKSFFNKDVFESHSVQLLAQSSDYEKYDFFHLSEIMKIHKSFNNAEHEMCHWLSCHPRIFTKLTSDQLELFKERCLAGFDRDVRC